MIPFMLPGGPRAAKTENARQCHSDLTPLIPSFNSLTPSIPCREIGYDGLLSAEQCSPIIKGHRLGTINLVDERYAASLAYLKGLLLKLGAYTGHKEH